MELLARLQKLQPLKVRSMREHLTPTPSLPECELRISHTAYRHSTAEGALPGVAQLLSGPTYVACQKQLYGSMRLGLALWISFGDCRDGLWRSAPLKFKFTPTKRLTALQLQGRLTGEGLDEEVILVFADMDFNPPVRLHFLAKAATV